MGRKRKGNKNLKHLRQRKLAELQASLNKPEPEVESEEEQQQLHDESTPWLTSTVASVIIFAVGFAVFFTGLKNPFMGDDDSQIVNNPVVHSLIHLPLFFAGSTFYNGGGITPLDGSYYRPIMTTTYSLLYTFFGSNTFFYHALQLMLVMGSAILLFLFLRYFIKPIWALAIALIFLVHPANSQVVYAIPSMGDALFFFFGMLAMWTLVRYESEESLWGVTAWLVLSLLSKEAGMLFVITAILYLFWFDRKRLSAFIGILTLPLIVYFILKIYAVGLLHHVDNGPINRLGLGGRLLTAPSVLLFYVTKFVFPAKLASGYFWTYPTFSVQHVLIPLIIDLAVVALVFYLAVLVRKKGTHAQYLAFLFFAAWAGISLISYLQIVPFDFTASETWFYFPMAGILGMIGMLLTVFKDRINPSYVMVIAVIVVATFGIRSSLRGLDWRSLDTLAQKDIAASKEDYNAYNNVANSYILNKDFTQAEPYVEQSIRAFPTDTNYYNLGLILSSYQNYSGAVQAYNKSLSYSDYSSAYELRAETTLVYGNYATDKQYVSELAQKYPQDYKGWMYLALFDYKHHDISDAKTAITKAVNLGPVPQGLYADIMSNKSFSMESPDLDTTLTLP